MRRLVLVIGVEMQHGDYFRIGWAVFKPLVVIGGLGICSCDVESLDKMKFNRIVRL